MGEKSSGERRSGRGRWRAAGVAAGAAAVLAGIAGVGPGASAATGSASAGVDGLVHPGAPVAVAPGWWPNRPYRLTGCGNPFRMAGDSRGGLWGSICNQGAVLVPGGAMRGGQAVLVLTNRSARNFTASVERQTLTVQSVTGAFGDRIFDDWGRCGSHAVPAGATWSCVFALVAPSGEIGDNRVIASADVYVDGRVAATLRSGAAVI